MPGLLYVVATPIGNLEDITYRAVRVLKEAGLIACEDTRHTSKLLEHYGIQTPTISYHEFNEVERSADLAARMCGFRERFRRVGAFRTAEGLVDVSYRALTIDDWAGRDAEGWTKSGLCSSSQGSTKTRG